MMKNSGIKMKVLVTAITIGIAFSVTNAVFAQAPGRGKGPGPGPGDDRNPACQAIPGLTEEQRNQIDQLRVKHIRKTELMHAQIGEKQARMNTLRLAEKPDDKAIDQTIDDISKLRGDLMKEREAHRREVRALLNDDQKAFYDSRPGMERNRNKAYNRQDRKGRHQRGMGYGPGNRANCPYQN